ncbi:hypothetical protein RRG08_049509 [Elysia crispata]|uniref:Uncharacterized protein n=1 Tax=Elysia crispata TaxID=231223 RepID=A0AAE1DFV8_9GAST|nr:hypothetical protein RRG08_049509 [Elysia crispata]
MTKQRATPVSRPLRARRFAMMVVALSLIIQTMCQGQDARVLGVPTMSFGGFLEISFINGTYDKLYECFCDIRITHCAMISKLPTKQNSFPLKYSINNLRQTRVPDDLPESELYRQYRNTFECNAFQTLTGRGLECRRLQVNDAIKLCASPSSRCMDYVMTHRSNECSFACTHLIFLGQVALREVAVKNFGDRPVPVKDGVCQAVSASTTAHPYLTSSSGGSAETEIPDTEMVDISTAMLDISTVRNEHLDVHSAGSCVSKVTGAAAAFLMLVSLAAFINIYVRQRAN